MLQELLIVFVVEVVVENKQPKAKATESDSSCLIRWEKYNVNSVDGVQHILDVNKVEFKTESKRNNTKNFVRKGQFHNLLLVTQEP